MTVYADVLFLINFSMDFLTLYFTAKLTHKPLKAVRLSVSAAIGALLGTVVCVYSGESARLSSVLAAFGGIIISFVMAYIAYGRYVSFAALVRDSVILWGGGALLGGVMTVLLSLGEPVFLNKTKTSTFAETFTLCFVISSAAVRLFSSAKDKKTVTVSVEINGYNAEFKALVDSGSLVREPISSLPVVIVSYIALPGLDCLMNNPERKMRIRLVPIKSVGGEKLLTGFLPDRIIIDGRESSAVVAVDKENKSFGGQSGIVPSCLSEKINGGKHENRSDTEKPCG